MTTKDIIENMEKSFDERFPGDVATMEEDGIHARITSSLYNRDRLKSFMREYTRTLLESFGEEVCPEWIDNPYGEVTNYSVGRRDERKAIRLKVKEILQTIK